MLTHCKTCSSRHEPPTGKKCQRKELEEQPTDKLDQILRAVNSMQTEMKGLSERVVESLEQDGAQHSRAD